MNRPVGTHLVGSMSLSSAEEVFTKACTNLPDRLQTLPDGETGDRYSFVNWQTFVFPAGILVPNRRTGPLEVGRTLVASDIKPTKYDEVNIASYQTFRKLRSQGVIPQGVRFQASIPTAANACWSHVDHSYRTQAEPLYLQRLIQDVRSLQDGIDSQDLAIQIDCAIELAYLEYEQGRITDDFFKPHLSSSIKETLAQNIAQLASAIDPEVKLGFHLCYGDRAHQHFVQPQDTGLLVEMANEILNKVSHPVHWIHMPVPKDRTDVDYFQPLRELKLGSTRLYLGLVHANDIGGTNARIKAAQSICNDSFGVATECGMGRTPRGHLDSILSISRMVTAPLQTD